MTPRETSRKIKTVDVGGRGLPLINEEGLGPVAILTPEEFICYLSARGSSFHTATTDSSNPSQSKIGDRSKLAVAVVGGPEWCSLASRASKRRRRPWA